MKKKGRLIVVEGTDGVGKSTQLELLKAKLDEENIDSRVVVFPQKGTPSAYFVDKYLKIDSPYGSPEEVGPYRASLFFALDRYDASFKINRFLKEGSLVLTHRYVMSNAVFQGGQIRDKEKREKYMKWLFNLEYNVLQIPKPDLNIILTIPTEIAERRVHADRKGEKEIDCLEVGGERIRRFAEAYEWVISEYPEYFKVISCVDGKRELSQTEVHEKIWALMKREISL
jgi:dTMP kinase